MVGRKPARLEKRKKEVAAKGGGEETFFLGNRGHPVTSSEDPLTIETIDVPYGAC